MKLTLEGMAERVDLSPNYIGAIENGRRDPSLSTLQRLADGLEVTMGELLGNEQRLSPSGWQAAKMYDRASAEMRRGVLMLLRAMAGKR
jgi:transcriptional regulator with XRE-family HTH domain